MSTLAERLKKRRRDEQEIRGYANSSRWYTGLSNAISFLDRAEAGTDPINRFSDAWSVAYNLFMMHGEPGDEEYRRFNSWVSAVKDYAGVRHHFVNSGDPMLGAFRLAVERVKKTLLKPDGLQALESWAKGVSPDKACRYFFLIIRDMRNTAYHPEFNPNTAPVKKAIGAAADALIPIVAAAVDATIEHPVPGTTGRATAYRFFLWPFLKNSDGFLSDYYLERLFPDDELAAFPEDKAKESLKQVAKQWEAREPGLRTADAAETITTWLGPVLFEVLGAKPAPGIRIVGEEAVFEPTFVLPKAGAKLKEHDGDLRGKSGANLLSCLIWTLPWHTSLDSVATDPAFAALPVIEVVHRALAASDVPWAIITNGRQLRLLSRTTSHKPRCFLEADLVALVDRRTDQQAVRAFRFVLGLFSARCFTEVDEAGLSVLDRVAQGSDRHGKEIGDELKSNVFSALQELGEGFLAYMRANPKPTDEWRERKRLNLSREKFLASDELLDDIYHESLSLMYRLLFLFYAESRELLPLDNDLYQTYSLESIRDDVHSVLDDPDKAKRFFAKGNTDLWKRLKELFGFLDKGWGKVIPPYNGGLFDPGKHQFLERFVVGDYFLARAIDLLSRTKPRAGQNRGEGRKKVTYRDLDVRHLGSIYEGILEYSAHVADQEYVVLREGSGAGVAEEYRAVTELDRTEKAKLTAWQEAMSENPDNPRLPRGCRVVDYVVRGQYYLVFGGRESKRRSSGSYYTPDYIVQYIVEHTLGPLVRGDCRSKPAELTDAMKCVEGKPADQKTPLSSAEILDLKVLDPAMGSGHFLVAATEYLARAYRDARLAEGATTEEVKADQEFIRHKRIIAERCIYGVDLNPMAVELAKLSMWLFTMDPGRPLSFLDHHLKDGNALLGCWLENLNELPELRSGAAHPGRPLQQNLFAAEFASTVPPILNQLLLITDQETSSTDDVLRKKNLDQSIAQARRPFEIALDGWIALILGENIPDYLSVLLNPRGVTESHRSLLARDLQFFHWELEFPDLFFAQNGNRKTSGGFDVIIGNPPFIPINRLDPSIRRYLERFFQTAVGRHNTFSCFTEQALRLLSPGGGLGLVVPDRLLLNTQYDLVRQHIFSTLAVANIADLSMAFKGAVVDAVAMVGHKLDKDRRTANTIYVEVAGENGILRRKAFPQSTLLEVFDGAANIYAEPTDVAIYEYLKRRSLPLGVVCDVKDGIIQGAVEDIAFIRDRLDRDSKPLLFGSDVQRYSIQWSGYYVNYKPDFLMKEELRRVRLRGSDVRPGLWLRNPTIFERTKILTRQTADRIIGAIDRSGHYYANTLHGMAVVDERFSPELVLGILNSSLTEFVYSVLTGEVGKVFAQVKLETLRKLPIRAMVSEDIKRSVERLVHKLETETQDAKRRALGEALDEAVFEMYELSTRQVAYVQKRREETYGR